MAVEQFQTSIGADEIGERKLQARLAERAPFLARGEEREPNWLDKIERVIEPDVDVAKILGGQAAAGAVGSVAEAVHDAVETRVFAKKLVADQLAVTDRRVLFCATDSSTSVEVGVWALPIVLALPRDAIVDVTRRAKVLQRGRLVFTFVDGSMIALNFGVLNPRAANRILDALKVGPVR